MSRPMALLVLILAIAGCKAPGAAQDPFFGRTRVEPPRTGTVSGQAPAGTNRSPNPATSANASGIPGGQAGLPSSNATASSIFPPSQVSLNQSNWAPPGPKINPVPAAVSSQTNNGYRPPDGTFGFPSASTTSPKPDSTSTGTGDHISIPVSATANGPSSSAFAARSDAVSGPGAWSGATGQPSTAKSASLGGAATSPASTSPSTPTATNPYLDNAPASTLVGRERIVRVVEPGQGGSNTAPQYSPSPTNSNGASTTAPQSPSASDKPVNIADLPEARS